MNIAQLRELQEKRMADALHSVNAAKQTLRDAISAAEDRERELREISDDIRRRLEAIDLVEQMLKEEEPEPENKSAVETVECLSRLLVATSPPAIENEAVAVQTTSRPMFPSLRRAVSGRSRATELSILP